MKCKKVWNVRYQGSEMGRYSTSEVSALLAQAESSALIEVWTPETVVYRDARELPDFNPEVLLAHLRLPRVSYYEARR